MFTPLRTTQDAIIAQIDSLPKEMRTMYTHAFVQIAENVIGEIDHSLWPRGMALANAVKRWNAERKAAERERLGRPASLPSEEQRLRDCLRGKMGPPPIPAPRSSPNDASNNRLGSPGGLGASMGPPPTSELAAGSSNSWTPINREQSTGSPIASSLLVTPSRHQRSSGAPPPPSNVGTPMGIPEPSRMVWYDRSPNDGKMGPPQKRVKVEHVTDDNQMVLAERREVGRDTNEEPPEIPQQATVELPPLREIIAHTTERDPESKVDSSPQEYQARETSERVRMAGDDPKSRMDLRTREDSVSDEQVTDAIPPQRTHQNDDSPSKRGYWANVM
ncbi:hypothetical protein HDK77DRAFT_427236 [Phyllosticta capitalensis]